MKTDKELAQAVVDDPTVSEHHKEAERKKLAICSECPSTNLCWSCGHHKWFVRL